MSVKEEHITEIKVIVERIEKIAAEVIDAAPTVEEAMMNWGMALGILQVELAKANERLCNPRPK